ncbi:hypothetical protein CYMTET_25173 [Cymbomonas tetramitiformis]|uniref:Uncharacterized protein n=1 Tax=Cymbomonas tetramitiformis TaxID=36881 RepID=A0AAE0FU86_9CHLO|nr:hypothetical protein CYMTET_25173 [Cymbomonas tetramitiformis]
MRIPLLAALLLCSPPAAATPRKLLCKDLPVVCQRKAGERIGRSQNLFPPPLPVTPGARYDPRLLEPLLHEKEDKLGKLIQLESAFQLKLGSFDAPPGFAEEKEALRYGIANLTVDIHGAQKFGKIEASETTDDEMSFQEVQESSVRGKEHPLDSHWNALFILGGLVITAAIGYGCQRFKGMRTIGDKLQGGTGIQLGDFLQQSGAVIMAHARRMSDSASSASCDKAPGSPSPAPEYNPMDTKLKLEEMSTEANKELQDQSPIKIVQRFSRRLAKLF